MIIGIDLGTTNSSVAIWNDGKAVLVPNALGNNLTPSVVSLDTNGDILVGMAARERLQKHPGQTASVFKRYMGTDRATPLGKRLFRAEELSSLVLRSLKADAEAFLGEEVTEAVITVPAYFSDAQRKATRIAGQLAGLKVERLLNEPTAAALAYGLHGAHLESKFLVFDLGGGTFDVSILELFDGVMEVRSTSGDNFLGGEDFVGVLVEAFMREVGKPAGFPLLVQTPELYQQLREQGEKAKRRLSEHEEATLAVIWKGREFTWNIGVDSFVELAEPLLRRLRTPVEKALRDARIRAAELDDIVLVGGATRMPMIRKMVAKMFGRLPSSNLNPDEVVALGAAVQAGLKMRDSALNEVVLTDVSPYTLGIEISERVGGNQYESGFFQPIIERNSVVPVSRVRPVTTMHDHQEHVLVKIYQGENRFTKDNIFLGKINVPVPRRRAGEVTLDVRFTYDINGLIEVEVQVEGDSKQHRVLIEENPGVLTSEQIEQKLALLANLKIHPREKSENRTLQARLEKIYEMQLGELREVIGQRLTDFITVLERQDPVEIDEMQSALNQFCDQIESDSYL